MSDIFTDHEAIPTMVFHKPMRLSARAEGAAAFSQCRWQRDCSAVHINLDQTVRRHVGQELTARLRRQGQHFLFEALL
ncbi:MAG: hypothetical protein ABF665_06565 [Gluconacetobacter sp.]